jgi:hypothetical protein
LKNLLLTSLDIITLLATDVSDHGRRQYLPFLAYKEYLGTTLTNQNSIQAEINPYPANVENMVSS